MNKKFNLINFVALILCAVSVAIQPAAFANTPPEGYVISVSSDDPSLPRDSQSKAKITANVKKDGENQAGKTVTFSVTNPGSPEGPVTAKTDDNGNAFLDVNSKDISSASASATVKAVCEGEEGTTSVSLAGLEVTITSQYSKIYQGSNYHKQTLLTCTVKGGGEAAKGKVKFTSLGGAFANGENPQELTGGVATIYLTPGLSDGLKDKPRATVVGSDVYKTTDVEIVAIDNGKITGEPHKITGSTGQSANANASIYGSDGQLFPGGTITFNWQVPLNQEDTDNRVTASAGGSVTSFAPPANGSGPGTLDIAAGQLNSGEVPLGFQTPAQASVSLTVSNEGNRIEAGIKAGRISASVTRGPGPDKFVTGYTFPVKLP